MAKGGDARTRRRVDVRREEILAATRAEIERVGLAAARVSDVAHALGVSTGLVFYHFGTKDELVAATFRHAAEEDVRRMRRAASGSRPAPERLRAMLRTYGPTGSAAGWRLWVDGWALAQHEPLVAEQMRLLHAECRTALRAVVEEGVADGTVSCPDPDGAASRLLALLDGLSVATLVQRSVSRAQLRRWVDEALDAETGRP